MRHSFSRAKKKKYFQSSFPPFFCSLSNEESLSAFAAKLLMPFTRVKKTLDFSTNGLFGLWSILGTL